MAYGGDSSSPAVAEYMDFGTNLLGLTDVLYNNNYFKKYFLGSQAAEKKEDVHHVARRVPIDSSFYEVRQSVCVAGVYREAVQEVKRRVAALMDQPIPLESFHVKNPSDLKDGALLVPKVILVGQHCAGRKLIDENADEGQLDALYDEACELGADVFVVYIGLPKTIYPSMRHMVYHPKVAEMVFPSQSILRSLARDNNFITVTEKSPFTNMQKNVLREWLAKPVGQEHPVYKAAEALSSYECSMSDVEFYVADERSSTPYPTSYASGSVSDSGYQYATEEHPLADKKKKKEKKKKLSRKAKEKKASRDLATLDENPENYSMELNMYNNNAFSMEAEGPAVV